MDETVDYIFLLLVADANINWQVYTDKGRWSRSRAITY